MLLTQSTKLSTETRTALQKLAPETVTIAGGTGAVSASVQAQIQSAIGPEATISRVGGSDRYDTSARISRSTFAPEVAYAFVASGATFPDALSAAAAAGSRGAPILLSAPGKLSDAVKAELDRLNPAKIILVGGTGALSTNAENQLRLYSSDVERIGGKDRFETSRLISAKLPQTGDAVYLANGFDFPDALAAGPVAAAKNATVLITTPDTLDASAAAAIKRLHPEQVYLVGGGAVVSDSVRAGGAVVSDSVRAGVTEAFTEYFQNCTEMRDANMAPRHRGQPGYSTNLDRDDDGIACDTEG